MFVDREKLEQAIEGQGDLFCPAWKREIGSPVCPPEKFDIGAVRIRSESQDGKFVAFQVLVVQGDEKGAKIIGEVVRTGALRKGSGELFLEEPEYKSGELNVRVCMKMNIPSQEKD